MTEGQFKEFKVGTRVKAHFSPGTYRIGIVVGHQRHYTSIVGHVVKHDDPGVAKPTIGMDGSKRFDFDTSTWVYSGESLEAI